jgi:tRNA(Arg) A34 adenosine deaminase TadA
VITGRGGAWPTGRQISRRTLLASGVGLAAVAAGCGGDDADGSGELTITQPSEPSDEAFMAYAFEMKELAESNGDQSFGAIVVRDAAVIGLGPSRVVVAEDATAHAEMEAIRDASRREQSGDLSGAVLYSTSRPCRMCETAAYWASVSRLVNGRGLTDTGAPGYDSC